MSSVEDYLMYFVYDKVFSIVQEKLMDLKDVKGLNIKPQLIQFGDGDVDFVFFVSVKSKSRMFFEKLFDFDKVLPDFNKINGITEEIKVFVKECEKNE